MTVTALVSGGKDSIFAASLADAQGMPVDELLTIVPTDPESMMFHVPNLDLVGLQAEAWGKRHRRVVLPERGEAAEAEVLRRALADGSPGVVVAGAIASAYQFTRLLRVADAVGRRVYAPLWGKTGARVVAAEVADGLEIRFVHLAAEGLPPEWLGAVLDAPVAARLAAQAGDPRAVHPAGEGGEFETLVTDAPFFGRRLVIDAAEAHWHAGVGRYSIRAAHLAEKPGRAGT